MINILNIVNDLFGVGLHSQELSIWHMISRVLCVYIVGIILAKVNKRFMGLRSVNNFFLFILIGSILATSIVGSKFYEILGMAIFIMLTNWLVTVSSYYFPWLKTIINGRPIILINQGKVQDKALNKCFITQEELICSLRVQTNTSDLKKVEKAYFENNGQISFILKT